jgi:hypothetical protein
MQGFRLDIPSGTNNEYVQEAFNTSIKEHLSLPVLRLTDPYPQLPQLSVTAIACDFCSFLKQCLLSKDVTLAIADQGINLDEETFHMGLQLSYSWRPNQTDIETDVGLDALYIYILNIDQDSSKGSVWGPGLGQGVFCVVRCTIFGSSSS